jgi:hypothetical protein
MIYASLRRAGCRAPPRGTIALSHRALAAPENDTQPDLLIVIFIYTNM